MKHENSAVKIFIGFWMGILFTGIACNKKFDEPPVYTGPDLKANLSIRELRDMHYNGNFEKILDEFIIEGTVVANDKKDNFYKTIVIQDSSAGITIRLDDFGLYHQYPTGAKIWIKLKDMWLGDYGRMLQLGAGVDRSDPQYPELIPVPKPLFGRHLITGTENNELMPITVRLDALNDSLQSCLVSINEVEFAVADTGKTYGDAINKQSVNNVIKACSGGSAILRTSGFAGFSAVKTPRGNGSITAVYSVFNAEKQLMIRDTSDIQMKNLRCTGTGAKILFQEDFESQKPNADISGVGWKNIAESGSKSFQGKMTNNNRYAEITAFATDQPVVVSWLILPPVNLNNSANEVLSFKTKDAFDNGAILQVFASLNYDGGNTPWKAKWTALSTQISKGSVSGIANNWISSGNISLGSLKGVVSFAFRYEGADPAAVNDKHTTSFQLDDVRIVGN